jgi:hypothetical protein
MAKSKLVAAMAWQSATISRNAEMRRHQYGRRKSANIINGGAVNARKRAAAKQAVIGISAWHGRRRRAIARRVAASAGVM